MIMPRIVLATHNMGKISEMADLLQSFQVNVSSASEFGLSSPEETEDSFVGNALIKARHVARETGLPALADDSGLCVNALDGQPGVYSADWAGADKNFSVAMQKVHDLLEEKVDRSAHFVSVFALVLPNGSEKIFEGRCEGNLVWPPRGLGGFGYDPIFVPEGENRTFGEMTIEEKKKYSHRAKAFEQFRKIFE